MHVGRLHRIEERCCAGPRRTTAASASLSRGLRQYFEVRLPIWPSVANAHPPRLVQRTQSVPRRGARPVLERMSASACRHPHTRAVNRVGCTVVEMRHLWRARLAPFGVWGYSLAWSSEPPHLVAGLDDGLATKRGDFGTICLVHAMLGSSRTERRSTPRSIPA